MRAETDLISSTLRSRSPRVLEALVGLREALRLSPDETRSQVNLRDALNQA